MPILKDMGYAVELLNADTESKPDVARTQAEKLIRDGAQILTGAFESGATAAIAQVCEQNGVPFVINIGADPAITEQGYKFTFRNFPTSVMLGTSGLSLFNELFKATGVTPKTAVLMHVNDTFGMSMLKGINALMPKLGLPFEIVETIAYDPQAKRPLDRGRQGQGREGRPAHGGDPPQRRDPDGPRDGEAEIRAHGHHLARAAPACTRSSS